MRNWKDWARMGKARKFAKKSENSKNEKGDQQRLENPSTPQKRSLIPVDRHFTPAEMDRIKRGVIPMEMEEKWFIFFKGNRLYFHRSWTGFCVYVAHFKRGQDGHVLHLIEANRDRKQYGEQDDAYDRRLFCYLIDLLLLGRQTPFPKRVGESDDQAAIREWN
jgi:hypothetical protein